MVGSVVIVSAQTCCALLHSVSDLKVAHMNAQCSLVWELMFYEFELGHNTVEAPRNICCAKGEGAVDQSTVSRWLKKFRSVCKNLNDRARSGRWPKTVDSEAVIKVIEANPVSSIWTVSCEL